MSDPLPKPVIVLTRTYTLAEAAVLCEVSEAMVRDHVFEGLLVLLPVEPLPVGVAELPRRVDGLELFKWFRAIRRGRIAQPPSSRLVDRKGNPA